VVVQCHLGDPPEHVLGQCDGGRDNLVGHCARLREAALRQTASPRAPGNLTARRSCPPCRWPRPCPRSAGRRERRSPR
jgi:hypothetical protein